MGKPRVRMLIRGLRECGVEVIECHTELWQGIQDKSQMQGARAWIRMAMRALWIYPSLLARYLRLPRHDWVLLGYPSMPDVFVIRLFAWMRRARIALDWFLSAYDTIVLDRALVGSRHPLAKLVRAAEWLGIRLADAPFMDTRAHARRMETMFGLAPGCCGHVWVGAEDDAFAPISPVKSRAVEAHEGGLHVLFYGQFIPLHGIATIIEAARMLRETPVSWTLVGKGQEAPKIRALLDADPLPALRWLDWIDYPDLHREIAAADVCLGIFGTSDKAASVIPNKVFQVLAAGRPLITRDSPAIRELVEQDMLDIALVPPGDARSLASAVMRWQRQPPMADPRRVELRARILPRAVGEQLLDMLQGHRA
jgi:glycosyltransferase involved in cell wall biosynthesis